MKKSEYGNLNRNDLHRDHPPALELDNKKFTKFNHKLVGKTTTSAPSRG